MRRPGRASFRDAHGAAGIPPGIDPADVSGLRLLLRNGTGITGDPASAWADQAVAGPYDYAQASALLRPVVSGGALVFDGVNDEMSQTSGTLRTSIISAAAWTWYGVVTLNGATPAKGANPFNAAAIHAELIEASWSIHVHRSGGQDYVYAQQKGATWTATDATGIAIAQSTKTLVEARYDGASIHCRVNGTEQSAAVANVAAGSTSISIALGYGGIYSPMTIDEIASFNVALDASTREEIRNWYVANYGAAV